MNNMLQGVQFDNVPIELQKLDRWILWKWVPVEHRAKPKKEPCSVSGFRIGVNNEDYHLSLKEARTAYEGNPDAFAGVGFVIPPGMVGVDLDNVKDRNGNWNLDAQLVLASLDTYCEVSPSGEGLKFLCYGSLDEKLKREDASRGIEMFDGKAARFFTITGHVVDDDHRAMGHSLRAVHNIQAAISDPISSLEYDEIEIDDQMHEARELVTWVSNDQMDDYAAWLRLGMALHSASGGDEEGLRLWDEASRKNTKYEEGACEAKWDSFSTDKARLVSIGSLRSMAKENGYRADQYRTHAVPASDFCEKDIHREYVVENFLADNEPMVIGGASKSLKTTVALDLAVSIATGTPFAGQFNVPTPRRVLFVSGESGETTTQETLKQICKGREIETERLSQLHIGFHLPKLDDPACVDDLMKELKEKEIGICIIDPLYRSLRAGSDASNVYSMGEKLELIAEKLHRAGVLCVLLHHFRKQGQSYEEAPELEELSQSGIAEFGRQFLLLKRRSPYVMDGKHTLWFSWGGSAGHQGLKMLEADTGTYQSGLTWTTELISTQEYTDRKKDDAKEKKAEEDNIQMTVVMDYIEENPGSSKKEIVEGTEFTDHMVRKCLGLLIEAERVEESEAPLKVGNKRLVKVYTESSI
jgi:hypothetical protein